MSGTSAKTHFCGLHWAESGVGTATVYCIQRRYPTGLYIDQLDTVDTALGSGANHFNIPPAIGGDLMNTIDRKGFISTRPRPADAIYWVNRPISCRTTCGSC